MVDSSVNRPVCKGMLEGVLCHIMSRPGITQQTLMEHFEAVLQPMAVLDLVQVNVNTPTYIGSHSYPYSDSEKRIYSCMQCCCQKTLVHSVVSHQLMDPSPLIMSLILPNSWLK